MGPSVRSGERCCLVSVATTEVACSGGQDHGRDHHHARDAGDERPAPPPPAPRPRRRHPRVRPRRGWGHRVRPRRPLGDRDHRRGRLDRGCVVLPAGLRLVGPGFLGRSGLRADPRCCGLRRPAGRHGHHHHRARLPGRGGRRHRHDPHVGRHDPHQQPRGRGRDGHRGHRRDHRPVLRREGRRHRRHPRRRRPAARRRQRPDPRDARQRQGRDHRRHRHRDRQRAGHRLAGRRGRARCWPPTSP